jgi:hypothetical protein
MVCRLRQHGIKNVCVHKGLPGLFLEEYCHTDGVAGELGFPREGAVEGDKV